MANAVGGHDVYRNVWSTDDEEEEDDEEEQENIAGQEWHFPDNLFSEEDWATWNNQEQTRPGRPWSLSPMPTIPSRPRRPEQTQHSPEPASANNVTSDQTSTEREGTISDSEEEEESDGLADVSEDEEESPTAQAFMQRVREQAARQRERAASQQQYPPSLPPQTGSSTRTLPWILPLDSSHRREAHAPSASHNSGRVHIQHPPAPHSSSPVERALQSARQQHLQRRNSQHNGGESERQRQPPRGRGENNTFGYIPDSFFARNIYSPARDPDSDSHSDSDSFDGVDIDDFLTDPEDEEDDDDEYVNDEADMPRTRQSGGVVDLTASSPVAERTTSTNQSTSLKRNASTSLQDSTRKRKRPTPSQSQSQSQSQLSAQNVEELDLTQDPTSTSQEALLKTSLQQAIAAQEAASASSATTRASGGPPRIGQRSCIICLDSFTNLAVTHCGHLFCHECLMHALASSEKNNERSVGSCPMCRKGVSRKKPSQVIPVAFMKRSAWRER